jgi:hypothetical protein
MAKVNETISMYSGETRYINIAITDADNSNIPLNITDYQINFLAHMNGIPMIEKSIGNGVSVINAPSGTAQITLNTDDTKTLSGDFLFEVEVVSPADEVSIVTFGRMKITKAYSTADN